MTDTTLEKDPTLRRSPEAEGETQAPERSVDDINALYGLTSSSENTGKIEVEDLTPRVDNRQVAQAVDGDPYLDDLGKRRIDEAGLYRDAQEVQAGANEVLTDIGMDTLDAQVSQRDAMNKTTAEVLLDGQDKDSGRLDNEDRRDARNAAIAMKLDSARRNGDTKPFEYLPPSVAKKVGELLGDVDRRYGSAESAPNGALEDIGAYVAFAEKVSAETDGETVTHIDPETSEVVVESTNDVIMRVLDDEPDAMGLLGPEQQTKVRALKDEVIAQTDGYYLATMKEQDRVFLVEQIRMSLLSTNAERMAA